MDKTNLIGQLTKPQAESLGWTEIEPRMTKKRRISYLIGYPPPKNFTPIHFMCKCVLPPQV